MLILNTDRRRGHGPGPAARNSNSWPTSLKYALIVVSSLPVLLIYPFVARYFTKGVMVGAVKG